MKKILKHLKPYKWALTVVFVLAFGMAICELRLPGLMADIVNVGIQQNGVDHSAPSVISREGMLFAKTFMTPEQRLKVADNYTLGFDGEIDRTRVQFIRNGKSAVGEDAKIYFINDNIDERTRAELDNAFADSAWNFIYTLQEYQKQVGEVNAGIISNYATNATNATNADNATNAENAINATNAINAINENYGNNGNNDNENGENMDISKIDVIQIYSMQAVFDNIPDTILGDAYAKTKDMDAALKKQTGATFAGIFYEELGIKRQNMRSRYIWNTGLWMLFIALLSGAASMSIGFVSSKISAGLARKLREQIFEKVMKFSHTELDEFSTSTLITRATNDVNQIQNFLMMGIRMLLFAPMMAVGGVCMAVLKAPSMSWIIGLVMVVMLFIMFMAFAVVVPKFKLMQKLTDKINLVAREHLTGMMVIRAFGTRFFEKQRFEKANSDMRDNLLYIGRAMSLLWPLLTLIISCVSLLIVWVGAAQISQATIQVGDMMAFMQYAMQIIMSFMFISMMFIMIPRAAVGAERIDEILQSHVSIESPKNPQSLNPNRRGVVEFKNVSFRYNGAEGNALENITFTAKPGETTAIIGATGSGKTTLVNLIMRYYDVTDGSVTVGGVDVRDADLKELRSDIGLVPQKGILFSGTIESNLKLAKETATDEELTKAREIAQATKIDNNEISQGGANVSGGQRQRLSIARALVKNAPVYLFDDSFSALDFKTDSDLRKALKKNVTNSTLIIVAQRVSTIMNAEQIIVLDGGKIVGKGTHEQLLGACPEYKEIAESQGVS